MRRSCPPVFWRRLSLPPWRLQLSMALAAVPAARRRALRPFASPMEGEGGARLLAGEGAQPLLDLASNDYLGLSRHPAVRAAAAAEVQTHGLGAGASRLVSGTRPVHLELEAALADWLGRERVLLIHHSLLAGVRTSGARLRRFAHNNLAELERQMSSARRDRPGARLLVLCESLYSMEGTSPSLPQLSALCAQHEVPLLVDEAHALGVLGPGGRGLAYGLAEVAMVCGTFGKTFGGGGAFLAADEPVGEWLLQSSGAFRYTTALAPPLAAGALAALELLRAEPGRGETLCRRAERWRDALAAAGWPRPPGRGPILPLLIGDDQRALALQQQLEAAGLLTVAIRPPTVPEGTARLRLVLRHDLPAGSLARLLRALADEDGSVRRDGPLESPPCPTLSRRFS
jgi:8-amino-7-oxononanoate synthase